MFFSEEANDCYAKVATRVALSSTCVRDALKGQWTCQSRNSESCVLVALAAILDQCDENEMHIRVDLLLEGSRKRFFSQPRGSQQCSFEFITAMIAECVLCVSLHHPSQAVSV